MEKSMGATIEKVRNHVSDDLAFSILSKLPLKSLKRFGCVRKSWALLLENPYFMGIFRKNFISNHHSYYEDTFLLLHHAVHRPDFYCSLYSLSGERFENRVKLDWPNPFQQDDPFFYTLDSGSITGTLCLYTSNERVVLWNPTTEEFKVIPPSPYESAPPYFVPYVFLHGFGYEHITDDYKLIRYVRFYQLTGPQFDDIVPLKNLSCDHLWEIYSLRSNSWRKLDADIPPSLGCVGGELLYMDEMCHWWGLTENAEHQLVSFDLGNEVFFTTPIPFVIPFDIDYGSDYNWLLRHLVALNGSIALISWYVETTTFHISILGELGEKESWTKLFIVGPLPCVQRPIGVGKKGDIFFIRNDGELIWFDLSTEVIEELGVKGEPSCHIVIYKESLLPIGGINH